MGNLPSCWQHWVRCSEYQEQSPGTGQLQLWSLGILCNTQPLKFFKIPLCQFYFFSLFFLLHWHGGWWVARLPQSWDVLDLSLDSVYGCYLFSLGTMPSSHVPNIDSKWPISVNVSKCFFYVFLAIGWLQVQNAPASQSKLSRISFSFPLSDMVFPKLFDNSATVKTLWEKVLLTI